MADKKISDGATRTLASSDVFEVENAGEAVHYKTSLAALQAAFQAGGAAPVGQITITQAGHGFAAGDAIGHNGSSYVKASAAAAGVDAVGIVLSVDGNDFVLALPGFLHTLTSHGYTLGWNYLDTTAGDVTTTPPAAGRTQAVLFATSANQFLMALNPGIG